MARTMPDVLSVEERFLDATDGTRIAYHLAGEGQPVLLANGLGGSWKAWSHQIRYFQARCRFVSWDYRGLYGSSRPNDLATVAPPAQARDGLHILDREKIDKAIVFGWSMGVQVALELARIAPDRVKALVLINGVAGSPWSTLANSPTLGKLAPSILGMAAKIPGALRAGTVRAVAWPHTPRFMKAFGMASETLDMELFHTLASSFGDLDMSVYVETLRRLGEHDAHDVLPNVRVPLLMMAGGSDLMTPRAAADRIVRAAPDAELVVVPRGTHYLAVEYPEIVNARMDRFLTERGVLRAPSKAA